MAGRLRASSTASFFSLLRTFYDCFRISIGVIESGLFGIGMEAEGLQPKGKQATAFLGSPSLFSFRNEEGELGYE